VKRRYLRKREGFTLIELLIVLAIIGALMAIGIPMYTGSLEKAKAVSVASNIRVVADSLRVDILTNPDNFSADQTDLQEAQGKYIQISGDDANKYLYAYKLGDGYVNVYSVYKDANASKRFLEKVHNSLTGCKEVSYLKKDQSSINNATQTNSDNAEGVVCTVSVPKM